MSPRASRTQPAPSPWDAVGNLVEGPATNCGTAGVDGGSTCLAGADSVVTGTETVTYMNSSGAAKTVFLIVDGYETTDTGPFELAIQLQ